MHLWSRQASLLVSRLGHSTLYGSKWGMSAWACSTMRLLFFKHFGLELDMNVSTKLHCHMQLWTNGTMYGLGKAVCCSEIVVGVQGWDAYSFVLQSVCIHRLYCCCVYVVHLLSCNSQTWIGSCKAQRLQISKTIHKCSICSKLAQWHPASTQKTLRKLTRQR